MKIGILGYGNIGKEVAKRVLKRGWKVEAVVNRRGLYRIPEEKMLVKIGGPEDWLEYFQNVDIAVITMSTLDDGLTAYGFIKALVEKNIPVVTSEKGALGNYFPELKPWIDGAMIGYTAVVGGGTRMLHWLKDRLSSKEIREIQVILNGTLNFCLDGWSRGRSRDEVIEEAKKLGYAESGAQSALEVVNKEACGDVPLKVASLLNVCNFGEIRGREIDAQSISEAGLKKLIREATFRRYIVSITRESGNEEDMIEGFKFEVPGKEWCVSAGFKNINENPLFRQMTPPGVNNAILVDGPGGTYTLTGPGAGEAATVLEGVMKDVDDFSRAKEHI